jgi:hypothetical protein
MGTHSAYYEPFAWWLARECIGADLPAYAASHELPSQLHTRVERIRDLLEGNQFREETSSDALSLLTKLYGIEGNQSFRARRSGLRAMPQRSGLFP